MTGIDLSSIDSGSAVGQLIILFAVIAAVLTQLKPSIKGVKNAIKNRSNRSLQDENSAFRKELAYSRVTNRNLNDFQLAARELIRILTLEMVKSGVEIPERAKALKSALEEIEQRSVSEEDVEDE